MSSIGHLLNQPLTITTMSGTTTNTYGDTVRTAGATTAVSGYLEQVITVEHQVDRDTIISQWVCFLPVGTAISAVDRVTFQTQVFQVDGTPMLKWNPRLQVVDHIECRLTVVSG